MRIYRLAILPALGLSLLGQVDKATLNGTVSDPSGLAVADAKVEIVNSAVGFTRTVVSDTSGSYKAALLPIGLYDVTVTSQGFQALRIQRVRLAVGQVRTLDLRLAVGAVSTQVEVAAEATPVDQSTAEIGTAIGDQQLKNIPINGRNWSSLMLLAPGATNTGGGTQNSIRFFGRPRDENNWTFDGTDATGVKAPRQEAALRLVISLDSIQEFRVSSAMYTADSGGGGGAQVNLVSKTGTNQFHGSAFEFLRNSAFDARRVFDGPTVPPFRLNQYGANLGGPIKKDKAFFFVNYEGLRQRLNVTSVNGLVPSQAFRQRVAGSAPALRPILDAYPLGNAGAVNADVDRFTGTPKQTWDEDSGMARFDYRFTQTFTMFARFNTNQGYISEPRTSLLETRNSSVRPTQGTVSFQNVIGPTMVNEVKLGVNRSALERLSLGVLPERVDIPGFTSTQSFRGEIEKPTAYSISDNFSRVWGRHTFKTGAEFRRIHVNVADSGNARLTYGSLNNFTANRLDSFSVSANYPMLGARRGYAFFYVQDEFKIKPNFTLNYGIRYETYGRSHERYGRGRVLDFERCGGFCPQGEPWYFRDDNNWAPRLSVAWAPDVFKNKTVFRAGGGFFFTPGQNDDVNAALDSYADSYSLTIAEQPALTYPVAPFIPQAKATGVAPRALQRDRRDAYTSTWTFAVQQQLPGAFVMQVAYVGNKGTNLFGRDRLNTLDPVTRTRPYPTFSSIDRKVNYNRSSFNGLQASLNRSFTKNWLFQMQYLYGKVIDDNAGSGDGAEIKRALCRRCERGPADFDIRQTATINSVYELPWARNKIWGGWSVSGMLFARTGRPVDIVLDRAANGIPDGNNAIAQRPDYIGGDLYPSTQIPDAYLNPAAFRAPAAGTWGTLGRNVARGPGLYQIDTAITKRTKLTEFLNLEFRAEAFNITNRAQLGNPTNNFSNATFGRILTTDNDGATGQGTSRQLQFMLRLNF